MPQHVRYDLDVLGLRSVGVGLADDALNDMGGLAAGEPPAVTGWEQRASRISLPLQSVVKHSADVTLHRHEVAELPPPLT